MSKWYDIDREGNTFPIGGLEEMIAKVKQTGENKSPAVMIEDGGNRVARCALDGVEVSTVFLGLNHSYGDGPPLLFETMVFAPDGHSWDDWQDRYTTYQQAKEGHAAVVSRLKAGLPPE